MSEGIKTYKWRSAPAHLRTRRQLAAEGLRPAGQDIAGRIPFRRHGRELVAHLFDVEKAAPKRTPTAAQLAALEKATRAHQLRAAERRGVEIDQTPGDPGPAWTTNEPINAFSTAAPVNAFAAVAEHEREQEMER
ncbi:RRQRL motif-containing zinc-binding protein [Streptomyces sp. NPDC058664]|uniref:RRQRL motif-containing zinc-binding protein n=1 Tax=Streptomyces sp. NPDC058664 TaxID=3346585 RepID=UPI003647F231